MGRQSSPSDLTLPPHSVEAEQALLGAAMLDNRLASNLEIAGSDFYRSNHQTIWRHIVTLVAKGELADVVTLSDSLERAGEAEHVGGLAYLATIANAVVSVSAAPSYAKIVRETAEKRRVQAVLYDSAISAGNGVDLEALLALTAERIKEARSGTSTWHNALPFSWAADINPHAQPAPELVEGLITAGAMSVVYGESNSGKTYMVLDLALSVSRESPFLGMRTTKGAVIYIAAEGAASIEQRVLAYQIRHQIREIPFGIVKTSLDLCGTQDDARKLVALIETKAGEIGLPVVLVVFDTLARAISGGNENSPEDMGALVQNSDYIRHKTGAHVLWIHHTGKDTAKGARGHSSLRAATDTEIEITHDQATGSRVLKVTKQRDLSSMGMERAGKLVPVELGITNQWGSTISACVVESVEVPERSSKATGPVQATILSALKQSGGKVSKKDLRSTVIEAGHASSGFYKAMDYLTKQGIIENGLTHVTLNSTDSTGFHWV